VTRPLALNDLPPEHAESLFALDHADSSWHGPVLLDENRGSLFYRLLEVIPGHDASFDEMRAELMEKARGRLQLEAVEAWLSAPETEHGLRLNREALSELPVDPGEWSSLPR